MCFVWQDGVSFLYGLAGGWGFSPVARSWVRFVEWVDAFKESRKMPYVDGVILSEHFKNLEKSGECPGKQCPWGMYHVRYTAEHRDSKTLYLKAPEGRALVVHQGKPGQRLVETWDDGFVDFKEVREVDLSGRLVVKKD